MEKKMETTIFGYIIGYAGTHWGTCRVGFISLFPADTSRRCAAAAPTVSRATHCTTGFNLPSCSVAFVQDIPEPVRL